MAGHERELVAIYADESCLGNGREGENPGGAAGVVEYLTRSQALVRRDYWISEPATTNNRMALRSVIEAFTLLANKKNSFDVVFTSDSQYLIKGMSEWVHSWAARGWRRKGGEIENLGLWLDAVRSAAAHRVQWRWVRGHDGHPQNAYADHLANSAAAQQTRSEGLIESGFTSWMEVEQGKKRIAVPPERFPARAGFRPSRALPPTPNEGDRAASPHRLDLLA